MKREIVGALNSPKLSIVPVLDQLKMKAAIRQLDCDAARNHFRLYMPQYADLTADKILCMLHAMRCLDPHCGLRPKMDSEDFLRARDMWVPQLKLPPSEE